MEEKTYQFRIDTTERLFGVVTANSLEEAITKIKNYDYDDIFDSEGLDWDFDTLEVEED